MAIGTMTSEPRPTDVRIGIKAKIVVLAVIMAGRIRLVPASKVAFRISFTVVGVLRAKLWMYLKKLAHVHTDKVEIQEPILTIKPNHQKAPSPCHKNTGKYD